jgi:midasin
MWSNMCQLTDSADFVEGVFRVHLDFWHQWEQNLTPSDPFSGHIKAITARQLGLFDSAWNLKTGYSMERLWNTFKPIVPSTGELLEVQLQFEQLAARFDAIIWKLKLSIESISGLRISIADALNSILIDGADGTILIQVRIWQADFGHKY